MPYKNKEDQAAAAKRHYEKNKKKISRRAREHNKKAIERNRQYVAAYLRDNPCVDCGIKDIRVLEFDHVRGKKKHHVSALVRQANSIETIQAEIDKCEVRCANCHRIKTQETLWSRG